MRAIGYVRRRDPADSDAPLDDGSIRDWIGSVDGVAGSWGQISEIERLLKNSTSDPILQIVEFCRASGHHLSAILGLGGDDALFEAVEAELNDSLGTAFQRQVPEEFGDRQFAELMERLEGRRGMPALVVIPDSTHLADDLETLVERLLYIRRSGSDAICTDIELPDPLQNGEELLGLRGEPDWLRKRIRSTIREKASRGKVLGRTAYGYRCGADGTLKPVPEEAKVVKQIFDWYVGDEEDSSNGEDVSNNGMGMRLIAQRLAADGVPTRTGKPWSTATVSIILKNRVYVGTYTRYGFLVSGNHEPIISRSLFRKAQDALTVKQRRRRMSKSEDPFLLGGLLHCGRCGHGVPGLTRRRSWRRQDNTTAARTYRYYEFYECQYRRGATKGDDEDGGRCPKWRADDLDGEVRKAVGGWLSDTVKQIRPAETQLPLDEQLENAEKTFLNEARMVSTGRGDLENLEPFLSEIKRLRHLIEDEKRVGKNGGAVSNGKAALRERWTRDLIADVVGSDDVLKAREALAALVDDVVVMDDSVTVRPRIS